MTTAPFLYESPMKPDFQPIHLPVFRSLCANQADETGRSLVFICFRTQNLHFHLLFGQMDLQELLFLDAGGQTGCPHFNEIILSSDQTHSGCLQEKSNYKNSVNSFCNYLNS